MTQHLQVGWRSGFGNAGSRALPRLHPLLCATILFAAALLALPGVGTDLAAAPARHFLWRVQGPSNTVHLLGSIHLLRRDMYPLPEPIEAAYRGAKVVAFETDLDAMTKPEVQAEMLEQGRCAPGETLRDHLTFETFMHFRSNVTVTLGSGDALNSFKPWLAAVTYEVLELQKLGFRSEDGVDQHYFNRAKKDQKRLLPLESPTEVIRVMSGMSRKEQEAMLREALDEGSQLKHEMNAIVAAWRAGDVATIDRVMLAPARDYPAIYGQLLVRRNKRWLPQIERLLATKGEPALVIVGAAHLAGQDSLLEMLRRQGHRIEQLGN